MTDPRRRTLVIPTSSGGALIASGAEVLQLDHRAELVRALRAKGNVSALVEAGPDLVAVGESGTVELARASGEFELIGSFGGLVPDGAAVQAGKLLAIVDGQRWLALDLSTGQAVTLASDTSLALHGPAALFENRGAALFAEGGLISVRSPDGVETTRVSLSAAGQSFDPSQRALPPARLISDRVGSIVAVQSGNDALVLGQDGSTLRLDSTSCLDPFRATPTANGFVLTCRSGQIFAVSERAP